MLKIIGGYFPSWEIYKGHEPSDIPLMFNHLIYAFMDVNHTTGEIKSNDPWGDFEKGLTLSNGTVVNGAIAALVALKDERPNLKVLLAVGGWGKAEHFQAVARDAAKLSKFVRSTTELVLKCGFDGVDLDWEYPQTVLEGAQFVRMLQQIRDAFNAEDRTLLISVAAPAGTDKVSKLNIPAMDSNVNFWNIMAYDFVGQTWSKKTGLHSNLYQFNGANDLSADSTVQLYLDDGVPPEKVILGMPMYGRAFLEPLYPDIGSEFTGKLPESLAAVKFRDLNRTDEVYLGGPVGAFVYNQTTQTFISYDNEEGLKQKGMYVQLKGLRGGFWWDTLGNTADNLLVNAFVEGLGV